jgi:hypothetical protein
MGSNGSMIIFQLSLPKKKSPMITMGLALSDPMGCYGFKPRYPVVQSKIAVFFLDVHLPKYIRVWYFRR